MALRNMPCATPVRAVARAPSSTSAFMGHTMPQQRLRLAAPRPTCRQVTRMGLFGLGVPELAVIAGVVALIYGTLPGISYRARHLSSVLCVHIEGHRHRHRHPPPVYGLHTHPFFIQVPASFPKSVKVLERHSRAFKQQQKYVGNRYACTVVVVLAIHISLVSIDFDCRNSKRNLKMN